MVARRLPTLRIPSIFTSQGKAYREGITEEEKAPPFSFGSNRWGKLRLDNSSDQALQARYVPRCMILTDPGVERVE
jgi:hypothetical protein